MSKEQCLFEELLAYHCAPTLKKCKLANMFHVPSSSIPHSRELIREYNEKLKDKGLAFRILQAEKPRITFYLYSVDDLTQVLNQKEIQTFLKQFGYPVGYDSACLDYLDIRMENGSYPHEIGIFLGYPLEDVKGFINNEQCCCMGAWKVYDTKNVERSKALFALFDRVREQFICAIENGKCIEQLV